MKKLVILQNLKTGEKFYSTHDGSDPTRLTSGEIVYEVIGYTDTDYEAQCFLFGKDFADREEEKRKR